MNSQCINPTLYFDRYIDCQHCINPQWGFRYMESRKGERILFEPANAFTVIFILTGKALISCNEFINVPFNGGQMALFPINADCVSDAITDTSSMVLTGDHKLSEYISRLFKFSADNWRNSIPAFKPLEIKAKLREFLYSVKRYLDDGITCTIMHSSKESEFSMLLRAYYPPEELIPFLIPVASNNNEFKHFIMSNYLKMKGVKEFVHLSGMNLSTFNRKFKEHFNESPYQWLIKQKSKHIYHALSATDKNIGLIRKEFSFADPSHFNRYCKTMFGASPTQIRNMLKQKKYI